MKTGWQVPLAALVIVILFAAFEAKPMATAADIASWIQGVGSLLAIIAAVGIYLKQYLDKKIDDENETRAFVQAIRDEVTSLSALYERQIGPALRGLKQGQGFNYYYPVSADALTIYNGASDRVGKVNDPELRRLIVGTYALVKAIISSFQFNNELLKDYEDVMKNHHLDDPRRRRQKAKACKRALVEYAAGLKDHDKWVSDSVRTLLSSIDAWLAANPNRNHKR